MRLGFVGIAVCVALGAGVALGEGALDAKQARELKKVTRTIDQIERAVTGLETSRSRGTPAYPASVKRKSSAQERRFRDGKAALAEFPVCAEVMAQQNRIADLEARLASVVAEAEGQVAASAEAAKAWAAHNQSAAHKADEAFVGGLQVYEAYLFQLGDRSFRALLGDTFEGTLGLIAALPEVRARLVDLEQRYAVFGHEGRFMRGKLSDGASRLRACEEAMQEARREGIAHLQDLGRQLDAEAATVLRLRDQALAEKRPFPLGYSLMDPSSKCAQLEQQIVRSATYLTRIHPAAQPQIDGVAAACLAGYRTVVSEAIAEIRAGQGPPRDDYRGADAGKLKAFAKQAAAGRVHGAAVVSVHLSGTWEERRTRVWDRSNKAWVEVHKSSLAGVLLVEHDATYVFQRRIEIEADHLRGDALQLHGDFTRYATPRPDQLIPRAKLAE